MNRSKALSGPAGAERYEGKRESREKSDHCPFCAEWQLGAPEGRLVITDARGRREACACYCHVRMNVAAQRSFKRFDLTRRPAP